MLKRMPTKFLCIDSNHLFGWAISQYLPTGEFEKLSFPNEFDNIHNQEQVEVLLMIHNNNSGFFVEYDLENPTEIKKKAQYFPLCPYRTKTNPSFNEFKKFDLQPKNKPNSKLVCDPTNKTVIFDILLHVQVFYQHWDESNKVPYKL